MVTTGGNAQAYTPEGFHGHTLHEFMLPLKRTATLCGMHWLPPFAVMGSNRLSDVELERMADGYARLLTDFAEGRVQAHHAAAHALLNELVINIPRP